MSYSRLRRSASEESRALESSDEILAKYRPKVRLFHRFPRVNPMRLLEFESSLPSLPRRRGPILGLGVPFFIRFIVLTCFFAVTQQIDSFFDFLKILLKSCLRDPN